MKKLKVLCLLVIILITVSSCSQRILDYAILSKVNVTKIDKTNGVHVSATCSGFLGAGSTIDKAVKKALLKAGTDYDVLTDGTIYKTSLGYRIEGIAVKSK